MNATKFLKQQHDEVKGLFKRIQATKDEDRLQELYDDLEQRLIAHTQIEEELFYPVARGLKDCEELVAESIAEHRAVDAICDEIAELDTFDDVFLGKVKALMDTVLHHVQEEEDELFPKVEKELNNNQLDDLGNQLEERYNEIAKEPVEA